ncbi:MAG: hypothetical protein ACOYUK_02030 [Patescibacteria group bacterium]
MVSVLNLWLPLVLQLLALYGLSQAIDRLILRYLGRGWYLALTWPGVIIHELSHFVGCLITFTRVTRVQLFYPHGNTLGMVEHVQTRHPVKNIIISIAPLFGVTTVMWLLARWAFPELYVIHINELRVAMQDFSSFSNFFSFSGAFIGHYWAYTRDVLGAMDFGQWQTYVFIYLMLTLSSHAAPSNVDLKHTYYGLAGLIVFFVLLGMVDRWLQTGTIWMVVQWLSTPVYFLANFISIGIVFSLVALLPISVLSIMGKIMKKGRM